MYTGSGLILHPRDINWRAVYTEEFVPFMKAMNINWRSSADDDTVGDAGDQQSKGSSSTWYHGRALALKQLGEERLGKGLSFQLKSRAKHSAYKECHECQKLRLEVKEAIRRRELPSVIKMKEAAYKEHLQWMLRQRARLEVITQTASNERNIVENSDKCGDYCLHIPSAGVRINSRNTSLWKYGVSLQANVFTGTCT